jgi:hypothetical protein
LQLCSKGTPRDLHKPCTLVERICNTLQLPKSMHYTKPTNTALVGMRKSPCVGGIKTLPSCGAREPCDRAHESRNMHEELRNHFANEILYYCSSQGSSRET